MQWEGLYEAVFNTFILTQAGRRRATHFVKLVSSQVEKIEKWSGLAIKQLTSYCVPSPEQMGNETSAGVTPVPRPGANGSPRCVIVCRGTGACMDYHRQHAAGWFQSDNEKAQCSNNRITVEWHTLTTFTFTVQDLCHMQQETVAIFE